MDTQLIIVIVCIAAAACYFARRIYLGVTRGKCGCCDSGCGDAHNGSCNCGCSSAEKEAQRLESKRLKFAPKK